MLENACAEKRRLNPARSQRRNFGKLKRLDGCTDQRRMSSMIVAARCDHGRRAIVVGTIGVRMHALVQLRRSTQRERPQKSGGDNSREKSPQGIV